MRFWVWYNYRGTINRVLIITIDSYSMTPDDIPAKFLTEYYINDHFFIEPWKKLVLGIGIPVRNKINFFLRC